MLTAFDAESRYLSGDDQNRELTRSIRREVAKLTEQWNHLINRSDSWKHRLDEYMTVSLFSLKLDLFTTSKERSLIENFGNAHQRHRAHQHFNFVGFAFEKREANF